MKIPKDMDFSVIDKDPPHIVKGFDPKQLQGTWYKVSLCFLQTEILDFKLTVAVASPENLNCISRNICCFVCTANSLGPVMKKLRFMFNLK